MVRRRHGVIGGEHTLDGSHTTLGRGRDAMAGEAEPHFRGITPRRHPDRGDGNEELIRTSWTRETIITPPGSRQSGAGWMARDGGTRIPALLTLPMRLIGYLNEQLRSGFWKIVVVSLCGCGRACGHLRAGRLLRKLGGKTLDYVSMRSFVPSGIFAKRSNAMAIGAGSGLHAERVVA